MDQYIDVNIYLNCILLKKLTISNSTKVYSLKKKIGQPSNIELISDGMFLDDDKFVIDYNIKNDYNIYGFIKFKNNVDRTSINSTSIDNLLLLLNNYSNIVTQNDIHNYDYHLNTLETMGFNNRNENLRLLELYNNNINVVITVLLGE